MRMFRKACFREVGGDPRNPGRGWCRLYSFQLQGCWEEEKEQIVLYPEECLAQVRIDIGAFRLQDIPDEALGHLERILDFFRVRERQVILRFAYDTEGKGREREPVSFEQIRRHMMQLGGAVQKYAEDILVLQGVLVGSWGEMHHSRYLEGKMLPILAQTMYRACGGKCFLAVRTPAQYRAILSERDSAYTSEPGSAHMPGLADRLALFNDGMFGSPTDLGTYRENREQEEGEKRGTRAEELNWQNTHVQAVPNGGEALAGERLTGYRRAAKEMAMMHVSYLSSVYQPQQLEYWKQERIKRRGCWRGKTGYAYIGAHLGYRFVIKNAVLRKGKTLEIIVENRGFANLCQEALCFLEWETEDGKQDRQVIHTDPRQWPGSSRIRIPAQLPERLCRADSARLFFRVQRKRDGAAIRFANCGAEEKIFLGYFSGTGRVLPFGGAQDIIKNESRETGGKQR